MHPTSVNLKRAAELAEEIESLENQLRELLNNGGEDGSLSEAVTSKESAAAPSKQKATTVKKPAARPAPQRQSTPGVKGTLAPAVVEVLKGSKNPLTAKDIYESLASKNFQFTFPEPRKGLSMRLYRMSGVQPLGGGLFKAKG